MRTYTKAFLRRPSIRTFSLWDSYQYISFCIFFCTAWMNTLISCFVDKEPKVHKYGLQSRPSPELSASFLSKVFFTYYDKVMWNGYKAPFKESDMWDLRHEDSSRLINPKFHKNWRRSLLKAGKVTYSHLEERDEPKESSELLDTKFSSNKKVKSDKNVSITSSIVRTFGLPYSFGIALKLVSDMIIFINPQLLKRLIRFAQSDDPVWKGIFYAIAMFAMTALNTLIVSNQIEMVVRIGIRLKTALISTIYRKSLVLSNNARRDRTVGEIVNLMAVDAQTYFDLSWNLPLIFSAPFQVALCTYFLWQLLGPSVLVGLATMIALIPVNAYIATRTKTLHIKLMKHRDKRIKDMNEVLNGIKVLKLYAWEPSFEKRVLGIREREIKTLRSAAYLGVGFSFIWNCAPYLVSITTFATYVLVSPDNVLDAQKAFVSLALFNILRQPFKVFPTMISNLMHVSTCNNFTVFLKFFCETWLSFRMAL